MEFLLPLKNTRTPLFYGLPKIQKPDYPLHPIVSECGGPTDYLSAYISHFIQSLASNIPSHIKDTKYFHNFIEKLPHLHEEGIAPVIHFMEKYRHLLPTNCPHPHIMHAILDFILKQSTFKCMDAHIHQSLCTSMGTRMALPYTALFMGKEERIIILTFLQLIYFCKHFIEDTFFHLSGLPLPTQILDDIHEHNQLVLLLNKDSSTPNKLFLF